MKKINAHRLIPTPGNRFVLTRMNGDIIGEFDSIEDITEKMGCYHYTVSVYQLEKVLITYHD